MADWSPLAKIVLDVGLFFSFFGLGVIGLGILAFTLWAAGGKIGVVSGGVVGVAFMLMECLYLHEIAFRSGEQSAHLIFYITVAVCVAGLILYLIVAPTTVKAHRAKKEQNGSAG